ncbi:hypothetical protein B9Z55_027082 [Caenorhabditis nigoni]|uniref:Uncharacterized protein n=1 Tax=Caenorhabditis nigoni TaxID=1611254 RepID=A0A2G5SJ40_9PELO|nr:hypothetical protein B9Z55_027082 [Caenorhabditis nigoni]
MPKRMQKPTTKSGAKLRTKWMASPVNFEDVRITNKKTGGEEDSSNILASVDYHLAALQKGPVFYVFLEKDMKNPSNFTYTKVNMVREDAYIRCLGRLANQGIVILRPSVYGSRISNFLILSGNFYIFWIRNRPNKKLLKL